MTRIPVDPEGRISLPEVACERLGIKPGDIVELKVEGDQFIIKKAPKLPVSAFRGLFKVEDAPDLDWREVREIAWREQTDRLIQAGTEYEEFDEASERPTTREERNG